VQSSGGKTWRGPTSRDCNHYLKWAFVEAANTIVAHESKWGNKHIHAVGLYRRFGGRPKPANEGRLKTGQRD
jgi:hypothetical protein